MSTTTLCQRTGLAPWQVARGMTELRNKGIIVPVVRTTEQTQARYCITPEVRENIELPGLMPCELSLVLPS